MRIVIDYFHATTNKLLGEETYTGIKDVTSVSVAKPPVYIRKSFDSEHQNYWQVIDRQVANLNNHTIKVVLKLRPQNSPLSIKRKNKLLSRGQVVECDFGLFPEKVNKDLSHKPVYDDCHHVIPNEMRKRRLAVVLSNKTDPSLVIPLSCKSGNDVRTNVEVTSLPPLRGYTAPKGWVKCNSVAEVSLNRLYFPVDNNGTVMSNLKISTAELECVKHGVMSAIAADFILAQKKNIEQEKFSLQKEKTEWEREKILLETTIKQQQAEIDSLLEL